MKLTNKIRGKLPFFGDKNSVQGQEIHILLNKWSTKVPKCSNLKEVVLLRQTGFVQGCFGPRHWLRDFIQRTQYELSNEAKVENYFLVYRTSSELEALRNSYSGS